jgi:hypothetical protein
MLQLHYLLCLIIAKPLRKKDPVMVQQVRKDPDKIYDILKESDPQYAISEEENH